ncbi:MAG TPA: DUF1059 domain-containing protein [Methanoregula sp.]|nr:DUF1059 domain-containing protein [Methanoregula sp.]
MPSFKCSSLGRDCPFEVTRKTNRELHQLVIHHIHASHNVEVLPADTLLGVKSAIRP